MKTDCETNGSSAAIVKRERFPLYWVLQGHDRWAAQLRSVLAFVFNMSWVGELTICIPASEYLNIFNIWCCLKLQRRRKKCWIIRRVQSSGEGDNFYCLYVSHQQRFCWQNWSTLFMTMFKAMPMFFKYIIWCQYEYNSERDLYIWFNLKVECGGMTCSNVCFRIKCSAFIYFTTRKINWMVGCGRIK